MKVSTISHLLAGNGPLSCFVPAAAVRVDIKSALRVTFFSNNKNAVLEG